MFLNLSTENYLQKLNIFSWIALTKKTYLLLNDFSLKIINHLNNIFHKHIILPKHTPRFWRYVGNKFQFSSILS